MQYLDQEIRRRQLGSVLVYALIRMLSLISPYLMSKVIDNYVPDRNYVGIVTGILFFMAIPLITVVLQTGYNYVVIKYVRKKGNEIALRIMKNLVYKENAYFDKEKSLELLAYSSKETVSYINFCLAELSEYYVNFVVAMVIFVILCVIHPLIGAVQLLYLPMAFLPTKRIMKNVEKEVQTVLEKNAVINQTKGDIFQAIEFIKLNRIEEKKLDDVDRMNQSINKIWGKVAALDTLSAIWTSGFATAFFTGVTFGIGAVLILLFPQSLQVGQLMAVISYCALLYGNINAILQTGIDKKKKESEYSKIFSYLELSGERERDEGKSEFVLERGIVFQNCRFAYEDSDPVLDGLNLQFVAGQWTGIVGTSGGGKSTVLDILVKLYEVGAGQVFIDDLDINEVSCFSIREKVTKITQDIYLFPGTVEENLRLVCPGASEEELWQALEFACLREYVEALPKGLKTDVGEAGKLMSGGERQRLSIAMGLLRKNRVLLLDEVTASLDPAVEAELAHNFAQLVKEGYTIISISHKIEFLKYADTIYEINNGKAEKVKQQIK